MISHNLVCFTDTHVLSFARSPRAPKTVKDTEVGFAVVAEARCRTITTRKDHAHAQADLAIESCLVLGNQSLNLYNEALGIILKALARDETIEITLSVLDELLKLVSCQ